MKKANSDPGPASKNPSILKRNACKAESFCEPEKKEKASNLSENQYPSISN